MSRHSVFWRDTGARHLQQVELRGNLEQGTRKFGLGVHRPGLASHAPHGGSLAVRNFCAGTQLRESRQLKCADSVSLAVDSRHQIVALDHEPILGIGVTLLAEACEVGEPILRHGQMMAGRPDVTAH